MTGNMNTNNKIASEYASNKMAYSRCELISYIALILNILYSVFYPIYISLHDYYHYIVTIFAILIICSEKRFRYKKQVLLGVIFFLFLCAAMIWANHSGFGVLVQIVWPVCIIYMFTQCHLSRNYIDRITFIMSIGWVLSMIGTLSYTEAYFEDFNKGIIAEGINPNTIAIIIVATCFFVCMYLDKKKKPKSFKWAIYLISLIGLYRTHSRTSLAAFVAVLLVEIFLTKKVKWSKRFAIFIAVCVIVAAILFPFVYVGLFSSGIMDYSTMFMGKRLFTGRQSIWLNLWNYLKNDPSAFLWGVGYNTELYSAGTFNLHNAYLMVFAQYGIVVLLVYIAYFIRSISNMYGSEGRISDLQFKCYQILVYALIVGFGETVFSYIPNLIFIAMAIGIGNREKVGVRMR